MYPTYLWANRDSSSEIASSLSGQLLFLGVRSAAPKLLRYQLGMKPQEEEGRGNGRAGSWGRGVGFHALEAGCATGFQVEEPTICHPLLRACLSFLLHAHETNTACCQ